MSPVVDPLSFSCPTCFARIGESCTSGSGSPHKRRVALMPVRVCRTVKSVNAISTAFESKRRRH